MSMKSTVTIFRSSVPPSDPTAAPQLGQNRASSGSGRPQAEQAFTTKENSIPASGPAQRREARLQLCQAVVKMAKVVPCIVAAGAEPSGDSHPYQGPSQGSDGDVVGALPGPLGDDGNEGIHGSGCLVEHPHPELRDGED